MMRAFLAFVVAAHVQRLVDLRAHARDRRRVRATHFVLFEKPRLELFNAIHDFLREAN